MYNKRTSQIPKPIGKTVISKELTKLYKELGDIDNKRRIILQKINSDPQVLINYVHQTLENEIAKGVWMKRTGTEKEVIPVKGEPVSEKIMVLNKYEIISNSGKLINITLTYQTLSGKLVDKKISISAVKEINPQIYQNLEPISDKERKKIEKEILKNVENKKKKEELNSEIEKLNKLIEEKRKLLEKI